MILNETLENVYEAFEGNVRKLEELISQLELWSDEYTINHKKEEIRLPEYIELHLNLEALKKELESQLDQLEQEEQLRKSIEQARVHIKERLTAYKETEENIHDWIKAIKNPYMLMHSSKILKENQEYLEAILGK